MWFASQKGGNVSGIGPTRSANLSNHFFQRRGKLSGLRGECSSGSGGKGEGSSFLVPEVEAIGGRSREDCFCIFDAMRRVRFSSFSCWAKASLALAILIFSKSRQVRRFGSLFVSSCCFPFSFAVGDLRRECLFSVEELMADTGSARAAIPSSYFHLTEPSFTGFGGVRKAKMEVPSL
jgi:hypothetical protein